MIVEMKMIVVKVRMMIVFADTETMCWWWGIVEGMSIVLMVIGFGRVVHGTTSEVACTGKVNYIYGHS